MTRLIGIGLFLFALFFLVVGSAWLTPSSNQGSFTGNSLRYFYGQYLWAFALCGLLLGYLLNFPWKRKVLWAAALIPFGLAVLEVILSNRYWSERDSLPANFGTYVGMLTLGVFLALLLPRLEPIRERVPAVLLNFFKWSCAVAITGWALIGIAVIGIART